MWTPKTDTTKNLTLWITHNCNLNCAFCRDSGNKDLHDFMSYDKIKEALEYGKEKGIKTVLIGGGEPTIHPDILKIAELSHKMGFETVVTTNYMKPELVKQLDEFCDTINISVYPENINNLPYQSEFKHAIIYFKYLLWSDRLASKEDFDKLIDYLEEHSPNAGFCCMRGHSKWCRDHKEISWLNELKDHLDSIIMTDRGNPAWVYRGHPIDRKDLSEKRMHHMMVDERGFIYNEVGEAVISREEKYGETSTHPNVDIDVD